MLLTGFYSRNRNGFSNTLVDAPPTGILKRWFAFVLADEISKKSIGLVRLYHNPVILLVSSNCLSIILWKILPTRYIGNCIRKVFRYANRMLIVVQEV